MKRALAKIARQPATCVAVLLIAAVVFAAIAAALLAPFSADAQPFDGLSLEGAPLPPGSKYWLGMDTLGRDLLLRSSTARAPRLSLDWSQTASW